MKMTKTIVFSMLLIGLLALTACSGDESADGPVMEPVTITGSIAPFVGETRATVNGDVLEAGEQFRMKIICPHSYRHELGEPWGSSYYTLTYSGNGEWTSGEIGPYQSQGTTYVYTAQNTTMTRRFVVANQPWSQASNAFHADQRKVADYKASDILWAQAFSQTGTRNIHLQFYHKVARLTITIDSDISDDAIVQLQGMPDIDGAEIVVGDYYADETPEEYTFNYKQKTSCSYENNGKVLGIEVLDEINNRASVWPLSGNPTTPGGNNSKVYSTTPVANTATYTACRVSSKQYQLLVPPCTPAADAKFWITDGEKRYSVALLATGDSPTFVEGKDYHITLK